MQSSLGSDAFALLALAFISLFVLLLLRHFLPLRSTPAYLVVPVFLALALPISIILLVPIDLASSSRVEDRNLRGVWLPQGVILVVWRLTYWLTFALTWSATLVPLVSSFPTLTITGSSFHSWASTSTPVTELQKIAYYTPLGRTGDTSSS